MKCLSLFSGIGGFDLACKRKGIKVIEACEIDKYARSIYARQFPGIPIHEDATKIKAKELPDFDLLCAGFPCQAFSIAGKRLGFKESRGTLFFEIARIAKQKRPGLLLLENVRGLLSHDKGRTFKVILSALDEIGYDAQWQVCNSKYFVPQNRQRIFIVGHLRGECRPKVFPVRKDDKTHEEKRTNVNALQVAGHSGGLHSQMTGIVVRDGIKQERNMSTSIDSSYFKGSDNHGQRTLVEIIQLNKTKHASNRIYDPKGIAKTMISKPGGKGGKTGLYKTEKGIRRLTPIECEKLQGFPKDFSKYGKDGELISDTQRYKCLGNAVTVPVVEYILERLLK